MGLVSLVGTVAWLFGIPSPSALIEGVLWETWITYLLLLFGPVLLGIHIGFVLDRDGEPYRSLWRAVRAFLHRWQESIRKTGWMVFNTATRETMQFALAIIAVGSIALLALAFGKNPFEAVEEPAQQGFITDAGQYVSPAPHGKVTFDYSNNNGKYSIGSGLYLFETQWTKASNQRIYVYSDPPSIRAVALVKDKQKIRSIDDAHRYDGSSRWRTPNIGQIVLLQNTNGFFAALKILDIKDDTRGSPFDELTFEYVIQTNGTPDFTAG